MDKRENDEDDDDIEENELDKKYMLDEFGNKIIRVREMTELEKKYFQEARKRHRENIGKKVQIVQGKEFKG